MSLEGDLGDQLTRGPCPRRQRPITLEYASANVPRIILLLKRRQLRISRRFSPERAALISLSRDLHPEDRWVLLESDFLRVKDVAADVDVSLFRSESDSDVIARIRARVEVEWAGEGVPA